MSVPVSAKLLREAAMEVFYDTDVTDSYMCITDALVRVYFEGVLNYHGVSTGGSVVYAPAQSNSGVYIDDYGKRNAARVWFLLLLAESGEFLP